MRVDTCSGSAREVLEGRGGGGGGRGSGTQKFVYQKWHDQIFLIVNFVFSHEGHSGLEGGGVGTRPRYLEGVGVVTPQSSHGIRPFQFFPGAYLGPDVRAFTQHPMPASGRQ